jgi:CDP-glucose 4,6-dehydratase
MTDATALRGRAVFVTGASGIVGSWLVRSLLNSGISVVALVRDEDPHSEFVRSGDDRRVVRVHGALQEDGIVERALVDYEIDVVFHLGARTQVRHAQRQPLETLEANVRGTYRLLEAIRRLTRPVQAVVIASSDKAYGESDVLPYVETHPLAGRNIYDASKSAADLLSSAYARSYALPLGIARCANIYGPGDLNWDRIVPGTVRALLRGERPIIRSDGTLQRDYLYVDDAVSAYLAVARALLDGRECGEAFNFGHGEPVTVFQLVDALRRALGRTDLEPVIEANAPNEIPAQWLDSAKARDRLGWSPAFDLDAGIERAVAWYRELLG